MADTLHLKGFDEIAKFFADLPEKMAANVLRGSMRAAAKPVLDEARNSVAKRSGALSKSLRISTRRRGQIVSATLKTDIFYSRFIEFGAAAHEIKPTNKKSLFFAGLFREVVQHPGIKPKPFMRPAMDRKASAALIAAGEYTKRRLASKHDLDTGDISIGVEE
jgi:HK97 gp10 family phage protein